MEKGKIDVKKPQVILSASKLETFEKCSWMYNAQYVLTLPQIGNSGAFRGTICHKVFEFLFRADRRDYYDIIIKEQSYTVIPSISRYIDIWATKFGLTSEDKSLIDEMILTGLEYDFFCDKYPNAQNLAPELKFEITNKKPKYSIKGFIDRPLLYEENGIKKVRARDFKSSKAKFTAKYLVGANQGFMYSLALKTLYPKHKPSVEFIFLRFPQKPGQVFEPTKSNLRGFELYLEEVSNFLEDFTFEKATENLAARGGWDIKWLCGKPVLVPGVWRCSFREPMIYYQVESGGKLRTAMTKKELVGLGKIKKMSYAGCPHYYPEAYKDESEIPQLF